jgi:hypothetical protein|nr:MAG TPA: hypothetical protein [Caudoviricetes sp.]
MNNLRSDIEDLKDYTEMLLGFSATLAEAVESGNHDTKTYADTLNLFTKLLRDFDSKMGELTLKAYAREVEAA